MNPYIGHPFQVYGVETYTLNQGKGRGCIILHAKNGKGIDLYVNADRGFDIPMLTLHGRSLSYLSPSGYVASPYYDNVGTGFLKSFTAGFLTTCGLTQVGTPNTDEGEALPLHGTYANLPCIQYDYRIGEEEILLRGEVSDETIFSHKLVLKRTIALSGKSNKFTIRDEIENRGGECSPLEILYHMNLGYPLLNENLILEVNASEVSPRDAHAEAHKDQRLKMEPPQPGYRECCYYYRFTEKNAVVRAFNSELRMGIEILYDSTSLPCFTQWKMMGIRDYVLGLEPGNCFPDGRSAARRSGELQFLKAGERASFEIKVRCLEGE